MSYKSTKCVNKHIHRGLHFITISARMEEQIMKKTKYWSLLRVTFILVPLSWLTFPQEFSLSSIGAYGKCVSGCPVAQTANAL